MATPSSPCRPPRFPARLARRIGNQPYSLTAAARSRRAGQFRQPRRSLRADAFRPGYVAQDAASAGRRGPHRPHGTLLVWNRARRRTLHHGNARIASAPNSCASSPAKSARAFISAEPPPATLSLVIPPFFAIAAAAYLLGSIPTGYLLVRLFRHQDIRSVGSGNIGATNVLRTGGKGLGAATFCSTCSRVAPPSGWADSSPRSAARCPAALRRGPRRPLGRARPHVPRLAAVSRRQRRGHRLWRLSRRLAPGPRSPPSQSFL